MPNDHVADCCNYIKNRVDDTPCRNKILELTEWIFSLRNSIKWYTREGGKSVAFFLKTQGRDHFSIFKLQKKCTQMDLYFRLNNQVILPAYLQRYPDNQDWARISGADFSSLTKDELQGHILNSYRLRLGELGLNVVSSVIPVPPREQGYEPTLEEFEVFLRSFPRNREISIDDAFDAFEQQYTENGRALRSGWQKRLEEKLT